LQWLNIPVPEQFVVSLFFLLKVRFVENRQAAGRILRPLLCGQKTGIMSPVFLKDWFCLRTAAFCRSGLSRGFNLFRIHRRSDAERTYMPDRHRRRNRDFLLSYISAGLPQIS
jgi:hypothetical protein